MISTLLIIFAVLAANWVLPLVFCWAYVLLAWKVMEDVTFIGRHGLFAMFKLDELGLVPWHARLWKDWGGVGLMGFMVFRNHPGKWDDAWVARTKMHEGEHCRHWFWLGAMFYVSYLLHMAFIYFFQKDKHPYLDCWSERLARKKAGQQLDFTPAEWPQGENDRWPWW